MSTAGRKIVDGIVGLVVGLALAGLGAVVPLAVFATRLVAVIDAPFAFGALLLFGTVPMVLAGFRMIYRSIVEDWLTCLDEASDIVTNSVGYLLVGLPGALFGLHIFFANGGFRPSDMYIYPKWSMFMCNSVILLLGYVILGNFVGKVIGWAIHSSDYEVDDFYYGNKLT